MKSNVDLTQQLLQLIELYLVKLGYRRRGSLFLADGGEVVFLIDLQRSRRSTRETVVVTINLGVYSKLVAERMGAVAKPTIERSHWRRRIGSLLPQPEDLWWTLRVESDVNAAVAEMSAVLDEYGLPAMSGLGSTEALAALWETGLCPGITTVECNRYLRAVRNPAI